MFFLTLPLTAVGLFLFVFWYSLAFSYNKRWPSRTKQSTDMMNNLERMDLGDMSLPFKVEGDKLLGFITVGSPSDEEEIPVQQRFKVAIDTMTGVLWLRSVDLCENKDCSGKPFRAFDGSKSTTYDRKESKIFTQRYSHHSDVNGFVREDTIRIGKTQKELSIEKQEFGEVNSIVGDLVDFEGIDGVLGLGLVSVMLHHKAIVWKILEQKKVEPVFGIYINPTRNAAESGVVVFGGKEEGLVKSSFNSHDVILNIENQYSGWKISITKAMVQYLGKGQEKFDLLEKVAIPAPMQEEISLPDFDFHKILNKIFEKTDFPHEDGSFTCDNTWDQFPDLIFVIGEVEYVMRPADYVIGKDPQRVTTHCTVGISSSAGAERGVVMLGRVFMKKYYTRFNIGSKQVQFAEAADPPPPPQPKTLTDRLLYYLS